MKETCKGKICVLGNLNGIEMRHWSKQEPQDKVKGTIKKAASGGGFILSDNHGEIPYLVPSDVLTYISESVEKWDKYTR